MERGNWRKINFRNYYYNDDRPRGLNYQNELEYISRRFQHVNNHKQNNSERFSGRGYQNRFKNLNDNNYHQNRKPYDRPPGRAFSHHQNRTDNQQTYYNDEDIQIPASPLDIKINTLISAVQGQGVIGQLVFNASDKDNATSILQNAIQSTKNYLMNINLNPAIKKFELTINDQVLGETDCNKSKQIAKNELCELVLQKLRTKCFFIIRKENIEEVPTGKTDVKEESNPASTSSFGGSKAYSMMLKMGWGGKGLGVQEQGEEKTVADKMVKNISKEGLGTKNVISEVDQILQDYISSSKITTLAFDSSFSKEERAQIHNLAQKYNLKSKSLGKEPDRRITISRKMAKWDLVRELLRSDLENDSYRLTIPEEFQNLWDNAN